MTISRWLNCVKLANCRPLPPEFLKLSHIHDLPIAMNVYRARRAPGGRRTAPRRTLATVPRHPNFVNIVEVGPRDGLQNEKAVIAPAVKAELVNRLARAGMTTIEAGSFVSPKWVPQMAGTADVLTRMERRPGVRYPVLVPNSRGLDDLLALLAAADASAPPPTDEIAVFVAATDAFSRANLNCSVAESLARLAPVAEQAARAGLRVRGYVSAVISCPYSGRTDYGRVRAVSRALREMGCYEVSLGDTNGSGTPGSVLDVLDAVAGAVPVGNLAGHFHDTFGMGVANVFAALSAGVRTFDAAVGGLGGCPYSPGATGNVATEDVVHALQDSGYAAPGDLPALVETGFWISTLLGRENASRAGRAHRAARQRIDSADADKDRDRDRDRDKKA
ncbi:aldolase [Phellopilus nigrolimitatus]|nr:aldolase [Phellopilus nigrolimitatus]